jgi:hypothetical protein
MANRSPVNALARSFPAGEPSVDQILARGRPMPGSRGVGFVHWPGDVSRRWTEKPPPAPRCRAVPPARPGLERARSKYLDERLAMHAFL